MANKAKLIALFVMVTAGIVGLLWLPLSTGLPGKDENVIPRESSKWHLGKGAEYDPVLDYDINTDKMQFSVTLEFVSSDSEKYMMVNVVDAKLGKEIAQKIPINNAYIFGEVSDEARPYISVLDQTIFSIRDIALEDKYLVKQAVWDVVFIGATTKDIAITEHGKTNFRFGSVDSFTVSYDIGDKQNKFWIVDNLPLPVKAEIYDIDGNLQYAYELTSLTAPSTPGFG